MQWMNSENAGIGIANSDPNQHSGPPINMNMNNNISGNMNSNGSIDNTNSVNGSVSNNGSMNDGSVHSQRDTPSVTSPEDFNLPHCDDEDIGNLDISLLLDPLRSDERVASCYNQLCRLMPQA